MSPSITLVTRRERVPEFTGRWIYFGEDYADMLRWEQALRDSPRISYADRLEDAFRRLRPDLIRWTAQMGAAHGASLDWWMNSIAGKNVLATPIFLHLCYLDVLSRIVQEQVDELLIVCDDEFLLETMQHLLHASGLVTVRTPGWRFSRAGYLAVETGRWGYRWVKGIGALAASFAAARLTRPRRSHAHPAPRTKTALIHTCIDDDCLGPQGEFRDRYFSGLAEWLRGRGYHVTILPWVYNTRRGVLEIFRWFRASPEEFVLAEDYLRVSDYVRCCWQLLRCRRALTGRHHFGTHDVTPLVIRERRISTSATHVIRFLLYGPALARWIAEGHSCTLFIDMFENSAPERPQIASLRKCSPDTLLIGYQHGAATTREFLPYAIDPDEWRRGLFPHRIVCSGEFTAAMLAQDGFPPAQVVAGPALRYRYLMDASPSPVNDAPAQQPRQILVVLALELYTAAESLHRLVSIREFVAKNALEVVLRAHPMMNRQALMNACGLQALPPGWRWGEEPLRDQLARASVVIGSGTAAQVDAAACGVPVVSVKRELGFDYNFLDCWSDRYPLCRPVSIQDLPDRLSQILRNEDGRIRNEAAALAAEIMAGLGKFDDAHFSGFI